MNATKMVGSVLCMICMILVIQRMQCAVPPKVTGSYIAWGEITEAIKGGNLMQIAFEETYDTVSQNSAFVVWMAGENVTFIQNFQTNQTFSYTKGKDCVLTDEIQWTQSDYPPGILAYEDNNGTVKFSLRQLLSIPDRYLVQDKMDIPTIFRDVPARKWHYEVKGRDKKGNNNTFNIESYWSDGTWNTSSNEEKVPLGFIINKSSTKRDGEKLVISTDDIVTNVFGFTTGTYHRKYFQAIQGVICANKSRTLEFPSVQNIKAVSIHSEMVLPDYREIKYVDTYFDPRSQLIRIDVERIREEDPYEEMKTKRYESEIAIGKMGVVFRQSVFKDKFSCEVIPFNQYLNDVQNLMDIKQDLAKWKMSKLFGLDNTNYVYIGKTMKRDIPCQVFQGVRTDWPEETANVTSLWEWCFNFNMSKENEDVLFLNDEVGLINTQVTILSSDVPLYYPPGFRMFHHFYEVSARDPDILDATRFDISRCFDENYRLSLQFYLDWEITDDEKHILAENLTSDASFLQKWKSDIYLNSGIPNFSLRIAKLKSTIADKKVYIKFLILNDYSPDAGEKTDHISLSDAEKKLRENVDKGMLAIIHTLGKELHTFSAAKNSLSSQINPDFDHHTLPPLPPTESTTTSTKSPFTLRTEATPPDKIKPIIKYSGHQPGTVAAISITTLLVGFSVGSAGIFYKYYGLPSCLKR